METLIRTLICPHEMRCDETPLFISAGQTLMGPGGARPWGDEIGVCVAPTNVGPSWCCR